MSNALCPDCGHELPGSWPKFYCTHCGYDLTAAPPTARTVQSLLPERKSVDTVLAGMADELREALKMSGVPLDSHPALDPPPPGDKVWAEYRRRGGTKFADKDSLVIALVEQVKNPEPTSGPRAA